MRAGITGRTLLVATVLLFGALAPSCGGGGDGSTVGGIVASFIAATPSPTALHVTMQPGSVSGQNFVVRIAVTDILDFFGAAFTIDLPTGVSFIAMDTAQSFLGDGGIPTTFLANTPTPDKLIVSATRLDAGSNAGVNIVGTRDLLTLTLRVATVLPATPITFDATAPLEVRNSVQPPPEGGLIVVTWSGGAVVATQ